MQKAPTHFKKVRPNQTRPTPLYAPSIIDKPAIASLPVSQIPLLAEEWYLNSEAKSLSPRSITEGKVIIGRLLWFLEQEGLEECGPRELRMLFAYMPNAHLRPEGRWGNPEGRLRKKLSKTTLRTYYARLRPFFSFLVKEEILGVNPMDRVEKSGPSTTPISVFCNADIEALFEEATKTLTPKRDITILRFLLHTGIRADELLKLRLAHIDQKARRFRVHGKGAKDRYLKMGPKTTAALYNYLRYFPRREQDPLFPAATGHGYAAGYGLTYDGLQELVRKLGRRANIRVIRCSPHTFRHTYATAYYQRYKDLARLQLQLGHQSLHMSMRYISLAQIEEPINALDEISVWRQTD